MGGYDLYGNYYPDREDALNAETRQCMNINADIDRKNLEANNDYLRQKIWMLEEEIKKLEEQLNK